MTCRYLLNFSFVCLLLCCFVIDSCLNAACAQTAHKKRKIFISASGKDSYAGSKSKPWQTLQRLKNTKLFPGDEIYLQAGKTFFGSLELNESNRGSKKFPITITSYGEGKATIGGGNVTAITLDKTKFVSIKNLIIKGNGRNNGNSGRGIYISNASNIEVSGIEVSGFQKSGIEVENSSDIQIKNVRAYNNGYAGIAITGDQFPKFSNYRIYIGYCKAENNPGDPTELKNHSGNGIVVGLTANAVVEYCVATNNGWDMPRKGNGPVGIWAWESDSVVIQHCISYRNHTSPGSMDGGGFDLDGGVTNSLVQYNLSYENEGYGFGIFQFNGATPWHHNTYRYNISFDDGNTTVHGASVLWWNGSKDSSQFHDCFFYNNVLYNSKGYALGVIPGEYINNHFFFLNNIIVAKDELMSGDKIVTEEFYGNDWWSLDSKFKMNGDTDFLKWSKLTGMEKLSGKQVGVNVNPGFVKSTLPAIEDPTKMHHIQNFRLLPNSVLRNCGIDLNKLFDIEYPKKDFFGNDIQKGKGVEPGVFEMD